MLTNYTIGRQLTVPSTSLKIDETRFIHVKEAMREGTHTFNSKGEKVGKFDNPPTLLRIIDLGTGELMDLIVPTVMHGVLGESYPDGDYVNRLFSVTLRKIEGKRYNRVEMYELEEKI